ncbi:hypothetical protein HH310_41935 [Actinoplanes sp. TBRC 11911]|uniref:hypothetical protein n=1 Tax=Actinoplanes sp. TBRC 11911 TaxID=2729386 RepID=UPI00145D1273|nr:hypothetical protein [Actinoplanes sp. TBRC 11911]NMO57711.1 hypothetical protein [Actinoplanes sp. TBRC 11911]
MTDVSEQHHSPQPSYPLPAPADGDPRFTYGLLHDIADVLQRNGFPRLEGTDWADLMTALGRFLYQSQEIS